MFGGIWTGDICTFAALCVFHANGFHALDLTKTVLNFCAQYERETVAAA